MNSLAMIVKALEALPVYLDANETALFARSLEYVRAQTYDVKYAASKARQFLPVSNDIPSGAETWKYVQYDEVGMAKIIANYADDLPLVDVLAKEFAGKIISIGDAYQWSIQDLRAAQMSGFRVDQKRAISARNAIERKIDEIAAVGAVRAGITGFLNNPNVPIVAPTTGNWASATPTQVLVDLHKLASSIATVTKDQGRPDTLLLPTAAFGHISVTGLSLENQTTILQSFLNNSPYIRNVDSWYKLDTAGVGSTTRAVAYRRAPEVVTLEIPQEFEQFPPQARNLAFVTDCHARVAGVSMPYPLEVAYMDGI